MKILYVTTIGSTMNFFNSFIRQMLDEGHTVDIATNENTSKAPACYREWGCTVYQIDTSRSPLDKGNINAIRQLKAIVAKERYDLVHCHTPVAAMCTRLACRKARKNGTKVFYTAHGFHFYKGAPLKNWLLYYPVEKFCAHFTDVLITINKDDYALAQKKMKAKRVEYVPGVGIDLNKFGQVTVDKAEKRKELGLSPDGFVLLSVGELNENKNHETVIRAIADMDIYYIIAGKGELREHLQNVIDELGMTERIKLLGHRRDVAELYRAADIYVLPSIREGLNVSMMEAMASGLPCIVSRIRGNTDLLEDTKGGFLCEPKDRGDYAKKISLLAGDAEQRKEMGRENEVNIKKYSVETVTGELMKIYEQGKRGA